MSEIQWPLLGYQHWVSEDQNQHVIFWKLQERICFLAYPGCWLNSMPHCCRTELSVPCWLSVGSHFQIQEAPRFPDFIGLSFHLQSQGQYFSGFKSLLTSLLPHLSCCFPLLPQSLRLTLLHFPSMFNGSWDYIGPIWIIQDNVLILSSTIQQP